MPRGALKNNATVPSDQQLINEEKNRSSHGRPLIGGNEELIDTEKDPNFYRKIKVQRMVKKLRLCAEPEIAAKVLRENPLLYTLLSGPGLYLLVDEYLRLGDASASEGPPYSLTVREKALPALAILCAIGSTLGFSIGTLSISYSLADRIYGVFTQNKERAAQNFESVKRTWLAFLKTGAISAFLAHEFALMYCLNPEHWNAQDNCTASDADDEARLALFKNFFLGPLVFCTVYFIWNSPYIENKKEAWANRGKYQKISIQIADAISDTFFLSRVVQGSFQVFATTSEKLQMVSKIMKDVNPLFFEIPAAIGSIPAVILQVIRPQHRQKILTAFLWLWAITSLVNLIFAQIKQYTQATYPDGSPKPSEIPWGLVITLAVGLQLIFGALLSLRKVTSMVMETKILDKLIKTGTTAMISGLRDQQREELQDEMKEAVQEQMVPRGQKKVLSPAPGQKLPEHLRQQVIAVMKAGNGFNYDEALGFYSEDFPDDAISLGDLSDVPLDGHATPPRSRSQSVVSTDPESNPYEYRPPTRHLHSAPVTTMPSGNSSIQGSGRNSPLGMALSPIGSPREPISGSPILTAFSRSAQVPAAAAAASFPSSVQDSSTSSPPIYSASKYDNQ